MFEDGLGSDQDAEFGEESEDEEDTIMEAVGEVVDVTEDAYVTKEIMKRGSGHRPKMDHLVTFKYRAYFFSDQVVFDQKDSIQFVIDESIQPRGLNLGLKKMKKGE